MDGKKIIIGLTLLFVACSCIPVKTSGGKSKAKSKNTNDDFYNFDNNREIQDPITPTPYNPQPPAPQPPSSLRAIQGARNNTPVVAIAGIASGDRVFLYGDSSCTLARGNAKASSSSVRITSSPLPVGNHFFYAKVERNGLTSQCSTASASWRVAAPTPQPPAPQPPSSLRAIQGARNNTPIVAIAGIASGDRVFLYGDSSCTVARGNARASSSSVRITSSPLPVGNHFFYAKVERNGLISRCSTASASWRVAAPTPQPPAPQSPSSLRAVQGTRNNTPVVTVAGIASGDRVFLYGDNSCTVARGNARASSSSVRITSSPLPVGNHFFYAKVERNGLTSRCSTASASWRVAAPTPQPPSSLRAVQGTRNNTPVVTVAGIASGDRVFLYGDNSCTVARGNARASSSSVRITSSPLPVGNHFFYAKVERNGLTSRCSTASASWRVAAPTPQPPSSLRAVQGTRNNTPVVAIAGIASGDRVFLYGDSSCTVARGNARASSSSVRITSSPLPVGNHFFYAKVERNGLTSQCSTASASWQVAPTPSRTPSSTTPFISKWRIHHANERIILPLVKRERHSSSGYEFVYNFIVDWGDGNSDEITSYNDPKRTHTYTNPGIYEVTIKGILEAWSFGAVPTSSNNLISIPELGDVGFKYLEDGFMNCSNLERVEGGNTSEVYNMNKMFFGAKKVNPDMSSWDFSSIETMHEMFKFLTLDTATYSNLLQRIQATATESNVPFHGGNSMYNTAAQTARDFLKKQRKWKIADGGLDVNGLPLLDIVIDITIGYSEHISRGNNNSAIARINLMVETANQVFRNSRTGVQLRIKEVVKLKIGPEVGVKEGYQRLTGAKLAYRKGEHDANNPYHVLYSRWMKSNSDLLALIVNSLDYCGLATSRGKYTKEADTDARYRSFYSVTTASCPIHTFVHEVGHNFGCGHNKESALVSLYRPFAFGFRSKDIEDKSFRTIMSYHCDYACPRIPYFSDPTQKYKGVNMGDANEMNNARSIRHTARIIKNFGDFHDIK